MASLSRELRRQLERTIAGENGARKIAESAAEQVLHRLAVDRHEPHASLTPDERKLRIQLRAHGRQLGDKRDPQRGTQATTHLQQAIAYEHWHRMLFARFLAENDLLLHPEHGVALSLDEVKELALGLGRDWIDVAAEFAQRMLLGAVFRPDNPAQSVSLPPEIRIELERKLITLPREVFLADDSLGWVYQFWQRDVKETVLKAETSVGADELAPVTQLFTEDFMVLFLLENTLGAWWVSRHGSKELRGYNWTYLRVGDDGRPPAGSFAGWPESAKELTILDPCMGSGHFLTFALPIISRMRAVEEDLTYPQAIAAAIRDNLFGLELDPRCSQIAAFNLALTAWKLAQGHCELPPLNLACSGLGINAKEEDWLTLAGRHGRKEDLMRWLYSLFCNAPTFGSLIDPRRIAGPIVGNELNELIPLLEKALANEMASEDTRELLIAAEGLVLAARMLARKFTLVATNVPYLGRRKQSEGLKGHCDEFHDDAKADLATTFVDRCLGFCSDGGSVAVVTPQNWLFLGTYKTFRKRLLKTEEWDVIVKLGPNAFQDMNWWAATTALVILSKASPRDDQTFSGFEVSSAKEPGDKADQLRSIPFLAVSQSDQLSNPDGRILFSPMGAARLLSNSATFGKGSTTGDSPRYLRYFWEFDCPPKESVYWLDSPVPGDLWSGRSTILSSSLEDAELLAEKGCCIRGQVNWGKVGVAVNKSNKLEPMFYTGEVFDDNLGTIVPIDSQHLLELMAFCQSPEYSKQIRLVDQKVGVTAATLVKVPFDPDEWSEAVSNCFPDGLPKPRSSDPTQWLFDGHPKDSDQPLQVAVARLLGYKWPRQSGIGFYDCPAVGPDGLDHHCDFDGVVCLSPSVGKDGASYRLRGLLVAAYGSEYNLSSLLTGKRSRTLDDWLRDEFFEEHCRVFHDRPFIWHIWDGLPDGFHALVNYHMLNSRRLEKLIYSELGDWIRKTKDGVQSGEEGSDLRLAAAEHLQSELKRILEGECSKDKRTGFDVFVRWKPFKNQPIGWDPDLRDGVRLNIRPWVAAARVYRATSPGVMRTMPYLNYGKDRGKERTHDSARFPWREGSPDRLNDRHLSLEEKRRARGL